MHPIVLFTLYFNRDPSSVDFSDLLYDDDNFTSSISAALTDDGILVAQIGEEDFINDAP